MALSLFSRMAVATVCVSCQLSSFQDPQSIPALTRQGLDLMDQGRYSEAEAPLHAAWKLAGDWNPVAVYNMATLYHRQGRLQLAERMYRLALEGYGRVRPEDHLDIAQTFNNLGSIYLAIGRHSQAIAMLERAVQFAETHADTDLAATALNNLASAHYEHGDRVASAAALRRALVLAESAQARSPLTLAYVLSNTGREHLDKKRYGEAETAYRRASSIMAAVLGESHPDYAISISNLANVYSRQKRYDQAYPLFSMAVRKLEERAGPDAPLLVTHLQNYAFVLKRLGRKSEANAMLRRAQSIPRPDKATVDIEALRKKC